VASRTRFPGVQCWPGVCFAAFPWFEIRPRTTGETTRDETVRGIEFLGSLRYAGGVCFLSALGSLHQTGRPLGGCCGSASHEVGRPFDEYPGRRLMTSLDRTKRTRALRSSFLLPRFRPRGLFLARKRTLSPHHHGLGVLTRTGVLPCWIPFSLCGKLDIGALFGKTGTETLLLNQFLEIGSLFLLLCWNGTAARPTYGSLLFSSSPRGTARAFALAPGQASLKATY
jgi:hypothetical protein